MPDRRASRNRANALSSRRRRPLAASFASVTFIRQMFPTFADTLARNSSFIAARVSADSKSDARGSRRRTSLGNRSTGNFRSFGFWIICPDMPPMLKRFVGTRSRLAIRSLNSTSSGRMMFVVMSLMRSAPIPSSKIASSRKRSGSVTPRSTTVLPLVANLRASPGPIADPRIDSDP